MANGEYSLFAIRRKSLSKTFATKPFAIPYSLLPITNYTQHR